MNKTQQKAPASNIAQEQPTKKIYTTPSIKVYGSINKLVQGHPHAGVDGGAGDDATGS